MPQTKEEQYACNKAWAEKNKEKMAGYKKAWAEKNKGKAYASEKAYRQTPKGKKSSRIRKWKSRGIISNDYGALYERYINCEYCENCGVQLTEDRYTTKTRRCLDHDHAITDKENVRNVLCNSCNVKRG